MARIARDPLSRARARPRPDQWADDEAMTLPEAVAVFYPDGPLTLSTLRTAARAGQLAVARVAGKNLTTPKAMRELVKPCRAKRDESRSHPDFGCAPMTEPGSSSTGAGKSAQAAAKQRLKQLRTRSRPISAPGINQPSASVIPLPSRSPTS